MLFLSLILFYQNLNIANKEEASMHRPIIFWQLDTTLSRQDGELVVMGRGNREGSFWGGGCRGGVLCFLGGKEFYVFEEGRSFIFVRRGEGLFFWIMRRQKAILVRWPLSDLSTMREFSWVRVFGPIIFKLLRGLCWGWCDLSFHGHKCRYLFILHSFVVSNLIHCLQLMFFLILVKVYDSV